MTEGYENLELIEAWLNGQLSPERTSAFEGRMESDAAFKSEVKVVQGMIEGIKDEKRGEIRSIVQSTEAELTKEAFFLNEKAALKTEGKLKGMRWLKPLAVAATIGLVLVATFLLKPFSNVDSSAIFTENYTPENRMLPIIQDRLDASGLVASKIENKEELTKALSFYKIKDYQKSVELLRDYPKSSISDLYLALNYLAIDEVELAINLLLPIYRQRDFPYYQTAHWYLSLCYLKKGDKEAIQKCKDLIKELEAIPNSEYIRVTKKLANQLKSH